MRYSISFSNTNDLTHRFFAIVDTRTGWTICVAGRQGLGTRYCTPISRRFRTKKLAKEWRDKHLAKKPVDYWIAKGDKYLINEQGDLVPCWKTERKLEAVSRLVRLLKKIADRQTLSVSGDNFYPQ